MPNSLSATGLTTATRAELVAQLTAAYQSVYGPDINLESDTPDGQLLNIIVQAILDLEDLTMQVYNSFDPDNAIGVVLDQRVAINGIQRQAGTYTTTNITLVTSQSVNLYGLDQTVQPVFTVADASGNQWQLISSQLGVSAGTHAYLFRAGEPGKVLTIPNTITVPVTVVLGVTSINNPTTYATLGINQESDAQLKIRRQQAVALRSQGYFQGLLAALENINGITAAFIHENTGSGTDGDGVPGHSIWVIVSGTPTTPLSIAWSVETVYQYGNIASSAGVNYISVQNNNVGNSVSDTDFWQIYSPIAEAIYNYRNAGCGMYGVESYTIVQIDQSTFVVNWDFVQSQDLFIKFNTASLNGINAPDITGIKASLVAKYVPGVYGEVDINGLATAVQAADPNTLVTSPGFSATSGGSYTNTLFPTTKKNQFVLSSANVIVLPIILTCPGGTPTIAAGVVTTVTVTIANLSTLQLAPLGGFGSMSYAVTSGSGSVGASSGIFTAAGTGTSVVTVTDSQSHTATCTMTVV